MLVGRVEFILIGGYAVNFHGYNRTTGDLDVWLKPTTENKHKLIKVFEKYDFEQESIAYIAQLNFSDALVFSIGDEPYKTDFLTKVSGVKYDEADKEKIIFEHEGMFVPFINLNQLVLTKIATGRDRDRIDIEQLQKVQKAKNRK